MLHKQFVWSKKKPANNAGLYLCREVRFSIVLFGFQPKGRVLSLLKAKTVFSIDESCDT